MTVRTWGYSAPIGEWIFSLAVPADRHDTSLGPLGHVLQLVMPRVTPLHRLRKSSISWGEIDANGHEQDFHELVEIEDVDWNSLNRHLSERLVGERTAVSALFLELDTWVISDAANPETGTWVEASAELQVSFLAPELRPALATVTYSTAIDVWLPLTYDQHFASRSNAKMSAVNLPRLDAFLTALTAVAGEPVKLGQSKLYADALSSTGFLPTYTLVKR